MNSDVITLQSIADTLEAEPLASQRLLAQNANMSVGLMNAVLRRFVERGWIMLSNVNLKKLSYAITPKGIAELTERSQGFARRTFALANKYNEIICGYIEAAKERGSSEVILYGGSYIKFLFSYACQKIGMKFSEREAFERVEEDALCIAGECCEDEQLSLLVQAGCVNLLGLLDEWA